MVGIEPTTYGLRNRCSTTELHWLKHLAARVCSKLLFMAAEGSLPTHV